MDFTLTFNTIANLIALGGLVILIIELKSVQNSLQASARGNIYDIATALKLSIIEHPELRKYFFDNVELDLQSKDAARVIALVDLYCLYLEQIATQSKLIPKSQRIAWENYIKDIYERSPAIKSYLNDEANSSYYSAELIAIINKPSLLKTSKISYKQSLTDIELSEKV